MSYACSTCAMKMKIDASANQCPGHNLEERDEDMKGRLHRIDYLLPNPNTISAGSALLRSRFPSASKNRSGMKLSGSE